MKALVTGAGGFIGSHVVEHLFEKGFDVRALVRYHAQDHFGWLEDLPSDKLHELDIVRGDVRDPERMRHLAKDCDVIFHLAALIGVPYSYLSTTSYIDTNVNGTLNLLLAARENHSRMVVISTSEVYGSVKTVPIRETAPLNAQSPYAASKTAADQLALSFYHSFELPVAVVRAFNTFGPRQSRRAVIPTILSQLLTDSPTLKLGSLEPIRDFSYVKDTAAGLVHVGLCDKAQGTVTNIGSGVGTSIGELAETCASLFNREVPIESEDRRIRPSRSEVSQLICDAQKAEKLCGWKHRYTLKDGLQETVEWLRAHPLPKRSDHYWV